MLKYLVSIGLVLAVPLIWWACYPDADDPKNPHYVAWKWHLLPMDAHRTLSTMTHDNAFPLVIGLTRDQLVKRFSFVRTKSEVRPYLIDYCAASRPSADVLFLNDSDWMVVMKDGKASDLVLCKG
jgi:hypothetical protein